MNARFIRVCCFFVCLALLAGCEMDGMTEPDGDDDGGTDTAIRMIVTMAGTGEAGFSGEGGPASAAQLNSPVDIVMSPSGEIVVVDFENHRVRSINPDTGAITTLAGSGETSGEDALFHPTSAAFADDGSLYVAAWSEHRVYRYPETSSRDVVAGTGTPHCLTSDPGTLAAVSTLCFPSSVGLLGDGTLVFSEQGCNRIRMVGSAGFLGTLAGTGGAGYEGDNGPAENALFNPGSPTSPGFGIAVSPEDPPDELFIADTDNHVIREVNLLTGMISTYAGTAAPGFSDGAPSEAMFNRPTHVFVSSDHAVWVVDSGNHAIRRIDPLGVRVETIAGTGSAGYNGDDLPASQAQLNNPGGIFVTDQGDVYIADTGNNRIRHIHRNGDEDSGIHQHEE